MDLSKRLDSQAEITLIDKNSYHLFVPSLYEVASVCGVNPPSTQIGGGGDPFAVKIRKTICIPYREIFEGKNINFVQAEISGVDLNVKNVATKGDETFPYDYLVIALGSQTADFGIPGVKEYAYQFKSIDDAVAVNVKIQKLIGQMSSGAKMGGLRILIGGAGFTGIEFAAEISCAVGKMFREHRIKGKSSAVTLIEAGPKILPMISDSERKLISKRLTELGVVLMENSPIEEVGDGFVKLKNGQVLEGDMVVWTAGIKPNEFLKSIAGLPMTDKSKIVVNSHLQVWDRLDVFAAGDIQEFIDPKTQKSVPALAYTAIDQGAIVARNIYQAINKKKLKIYKPNYQIWIAPVGGKFALAHLWGGWQLKGFIGWLVREIVDLRYLLSILSFKKAAALFWQEITMFTKND